MSRELERILQDTAVETDLPVEPRQLVRRGRRRRRVRHAATALVAGLVLVLGAVTVSSLLSTAPRQPEIVGEPSPRSTSSELDFSAIAGTWEGRGVDTPEADKTSVGFVVHASFDASAASGEVVGTARWFGPDGAAECDVDLLANGAARPEYVVAEFVTADFTDDDACKNGFVELTLRADGTLVYRFGPRSRAPITIELSRVDP